MKKLFYAASVYLVLGLTAGLYYRELTKANDNTTAEGFTQLSVVHTHILTLGVIVFLIVLALEKVFTLSNTKVFGWFFWIYNLGLVVSVTTMTINGTLHVLGEETGKALEGISGSGHILLTAGLILLFVTLGKSLNTQQPGLTPSDARTDSSL